jgi:hypothetical protein
MFTSVFLSLNLLHGKTARTIEIDVTKTDRLKLSDIAEEVKAIPLENTNDWFNGVFMSDEYFFVAGEQTVYQHDLSGKLLRRIEYPEIISSITGDVEKEILFVAIGNKLLFYDFSCKRIKEVETKYDIGYSFFYDGKIWIRSGAITDDSIDPCRISYWDISLNKEIFTSFEMELLSVHEESEVFAYPRFCFSIFENKPVFSFGDAGAIYGFDGLKVKPVIKWNINAPVRNPLERGIFNCNAIVGKYLFVNYCRLLTPEEKEYRDVFYLYLEDLKTKKALNVKYKYNMAKLVEGMEDDIYHTGYCKIENTLNKEGYFYFSKTASDVKKSSAGNIPVKGGRVVFIVKTKK